MQNDTFGDFSLCIRLSPAGTLLRGRRLWYESGMSRFGFVTIQMKLLQQYSHMVIFIEYGVLTFEYVDEILWCYHSNETSSAVLSHGTIYLVCSSNF